MQNQKMLKQAWGRGHISDTAEVDKAAFYQMHSARLMLPVSHPEQNTKGVRGTGAVRGHVAKLRTLLLFLGVILHFHHFYDALVFRTMHNFLMTSFLG